MDETALNALTKERLVSHFVYISPALLEMCCAKAYAVYDSRKPQPMLGGIPLPRASNNPRKDTWQSLELDWFMYHIEGTGLMYKAFIPPRVPVHDFHSGKEPPTSEWQPERYPFENDTEFLEIDEEEIDQNQENQRGRYKRPATRRKFLQKRS